MCPSYSRLSTLPSRYLIIIIHSLIPLFAALTVLFLILPAVSGNKTGFYWVNIEYEGDEGTWEVGALGNCQYGTEYVFLFSFFLPGERGLKVATKVDLDDYYPVDALLLSRQILHIGDLFIAFTFSTSPVRLSSPLSFPHVELVLG